MCLCYTAWVKMMWAVVAWGGAGLCRKFSNCGGINLRPMSPSNISCFFCLGRTGGLSGVSGGIWGSRKTHHTHPQGPWNPPNLYDKTQPAADSVRGGGHCLAPRPGGGSCHRRFYAKKSLSWFFFSNRFFCGCGCGCSCGLFLCLLGPPQKRSGEFFPTRNQKCGGLKEPNILDLIFQTHLLFIMLFSRPPKTPF